MGCNLQLSYFVELTVSYTIAYNILYNYYNTVLEISGTCTQALRTQVGPNIKTEFTS